MVQANSPEVVNNIGALFIGMVLGCALWGVSCVQTWFYYDNYRNDHAALKYLVFFVWLFDTIHQILVVHVLYMYTIAHFGDFDNLNNILWSLYIEVLFCAFTGFLVQSFFAHRIWQFKKNYFLMVLILVLILGELVTSVAYVAQGFAQGLDTSDKLRHLKGLSMTVNVLAAAGDVVISAAICTMLSSSKTGFTWSNHVINRLMLFSINTGLLTSICACLSLVLILVLPNTLWYFTFYFIIGRFYANSLLATLNARRRIQKSGQPKASAGESHSLTNRAGNRRVTDIMSAHQDRGGPNTEIQVQIETIIDYNNATNTGITKEEVDHDLSDDPERQSSTPSLKSKLSGF
ncbi:hypothetical protein VKT23_013760 [Stygiomarasmius scandens]|uniref:DUF6534 domain-containing protein n=1 Tax=Marasmiellus scandens TaxID=2682957 RepID=A0ABR1J137_9AGAR